MGTRHRQAVISKKGILKVQQYGQWDGYPSGQGSEILRYLKSGDIKKYHKNLTKLKKATKAQLKIVEDDENWTQNYPYLSRDCGSRIHQMIEDGTVPFVIHTPEEECRQWCEGFYTIDFHKGLFISEYYGKIKSYPLDNLPDDDVYLKDMEDETEEE